MPFQPVRELCIDAKVQPWTLEINYVDQMGTRIDTWGHENSKVRTEEVGRLLSVIFRLLLWPSFKDYL